MKIKMSQLREMIREEVKASQEALDESLAGALAVGALGWLGTAAYQKLRDAFKRRDKLAMKKIAQEENRRREAEYAKNKEAFEAKVKSARKLAENNPELKKAIKEWSDDVYTYPEDMYTTYGAFIEAPQEEMWNNSVESIYQKAMKAAPAGMTERFDATRSPYRRK